MTLEGPFSGMFPDKHEPTDMAKVIATFGLPYMPGQMLTPGEAEIAGRIVGAVKSLRLLLLV